jgi:hypothetical protein
MAEDMIEKAPLRRDWLSYLIQGAATFIAVIIAILTWGQQIESRINDQRVTVSGLIERVHAIEIERRAETESRRAANAALSLKIGTMSQQLATISAQLDDLRRTLKR